MRFIQLGMGAFSEVSLETVGRLAVHHDITDYGIARQIGVVNQEAKSSQILVYADSEGMRLSGVKLIQGHFPRQEEEILVSKVTMAGLKGVNIGDAVTLSVQINRQDELDYAEEKTFVIAGVIENQADQWRTSDTPYQTLYVSKAFMDQVMPQKDQLFHFYFRTSAVATYTTNEIEAQINAIASQFAIMDNDVTLNKAYLFANYVDPTIQVAIGGIMLIILVAGALTLYSIYYVEMPDRIQAYGKLRAIGTSSKQLKQIVFREGIGVALMAIPLGLLIGSIALKGVFLEVLNHYQDQNVMMSVMQDILEKGQMTLFHGRFYVMTLVVTFLTVSLALIKPMKMVSQISEIEAIRYYSEGYIAPKSRQKSVLKFLKHHSKGQNKQVPQKLGSLQLALLHLLRKGKRTGVTILSMAVTGIFIMVIATVLSCADPRESANHEIHGQYVLSLNVEEGNKEHPERAWQQLIRDNPLEGGLVKRLEAITGVNRVEVFKSLRVDSPVFGENHERILGVPDAEMNTLLGGIYGGHASAEDLSSGKNVVVDKTILNWYPDIKVGDTLEIEIKEGLSKESVPIKVIGIGDYKSGFTNYNYLLMSQKGLEGLCPLETAYSIHIFTPNQSSNHEIERQLKDIVKSDSRLVLETWQENYDEWVMNLSFVRGASYAFLGVLGAICLMNMVNTMIHSVKLRRREIATMQAIGMTDRQLARQLQMEGLFYTLGTLVLSIGLGSLLGYPLFKWAKWNGYFSISHYHYPWQAAVVLSVVLMGVQLILSLVLSRSVHKASLVERYHS